MDTIYVSGVLGVQVQTVPLKEDEVADPCIEEYVLDNWTPGHSTRLLQTKKHPALFSLDAPKKLPATEFTAGASQDMTPKVLNTEKENVPLTEIVSNNANIKSAYDNWLQMECIDQF